MAPEVARKKVLVLGTAGRTSVATLFDDGAAVLGREAEVIRETDTARADRERILATVHGVFGTPTTSDIRAAGLLEVIGFPGSGTELIDVTTATELGVAVVNAIGGQSGSVAEHALGLMLSLAKRIAIADRWMHVEKRFPGRERFVGNGWPHGFPHELGAKTVGLLGLGSIGRDLADRCRIAFGMRVLAYDPYVDPAEAARRDVVLVSRLTELLGASDFVVLCLPLSAQSRRLIGEAELRTMKRDAYLINVSRGGTVDEPALVRALVEGWIAGAGIDVFDPEPPADHHPLFDLENVVLTAHIAGWTAEALPRLARIAAEEMLAVLRGERPGRLVNPECWPRRLERLRRAP